LKYLFCLIEMEAANIAEYAEKHNLESTDNDIDLEVIRNDQFIGYKHIMKIYNERERMILYVHILCKTCFSADSSTDKSYENSIFVRVKDEYTNQGCGKCGVKKRVTTQKEKYTAEVKQWMEKLKYTIDGNYPIIDRTKTKITYICSDENCNGTDDQREIYQKSFGKLLELLKNKGKPCGCVIQEGALYSERRR